MTKRCFDLAWCLMGLLLFSPVLLLFPALIYLEDRGPIFFRQTRLGLGRCPFRILKLRTMAGGKVTRVGAWLRRSGLDEAPQFLHVLRGEMSMVGPRPLDPEIVARLGWDRSRFDPRWSVKPGITGWTQILGSYGAEESWGYDQRHLGSSATLWQDTKLITLSLLVALAGKTRVRGWLRELGVLQKRKSLQLIFPIVLLFGSFPSVDDQSSSLLAWPCSLVRDSPHQNVGEPLQQP